MSETLAQALIKAQNHLPAVPKNATAEVPTKNGGKYSYSYVTLDSLIAKTLPILNAYGIAITQAPEYIDGYGLGLRTTLTHETGETVSSVMPIPHAGQSMQDLGGAITYARRYAWASVLGIASEHDDDAGAITHTAKQPEPTSDKQNVDAGGDPGDVVLTFGKHKDTPIRDVPRPYLEWWVGQEPPKTEQQKTQRAAAELFLVGATAGVAAEVLVGAGNPDDDIPF